MTSMDRRGKDDELLSPSNSLLTIIDYQPLQVNSIGSMKHADLIVNATMVAKIAKLYKLPIVLTTVRANGKAENDTIPSIKKSGRRFSPFL